MQLLKDLFEIMDDGFDNLIKIFKGEIKYEPKYCNACGKRWYPPMHSYIRYGKTTIYLCGICEIEYKSYSKMLQQLGPRRTVFDMLIEDYGNTS